jgi:uncharacterized membrane protein (GlpM family)
MSILELLLRFLAGGILVVGVSLFAKARQPLLAGLFMLFPAVTLAGLYFAGRTTETASLKKIALFSMAGLPATFVFLAVFYAIIGKMGLVPSLALSVAAWCGAAAILAIIIHAFA